jgi:hypothetical protein
MSILSFCTFARSDSLWILLFLILPLRLLGSNLTTLYESELLYNMPVITRSQSKASYVPPVELPVSSSLTNTPFLDGDSTTMLHATTSSISVPDYDRIFKNPLE